MKRRVSARDANDLMETQATGCPLTAALHAVGGKWSLIVLYWLDLGSRRFNELRRLMPEISHKVLSETLRHLEQQALICRTVQPCMPPHVEYRLSEHGESVRPLIHAMRTWGRHHLTSSAGVARGGASERRNRQSHDDAGR